MRIPLSSIFFTATLLFCNSAISASGVWFLIDPQGSGSLRILQSNGHARFQLERDVGSPTYNSGFIEGKMEIRGQNGKFHSDDLDCNLTFNFKKERVVVSQGGGCGFGHNVDASGTYKLDKSEKLRFYNGDPRVGSSDTLYEQ